MSMMLFGCMLGDGLLFLPKRAWCCCGKCLFCCFVSSVLSKRGRGGLEHAWPNKSHFSFFICLVFFNEFELEPG
jgi:hypothetical protein